MKSAPYRAAVNASAKQTVNRWNRRKIGSEEFPRREAVVQTYSVDTQVAVIQNT